MAEENLYLSKCQKERSRQKKQRQRIWLDSYIFKGKEIFMLTLSVSRKCEPDIFYQENYIENVGLTKVK